MGRGRALAEPWKELSLLPSRPASTRGHVLLPEKVPSTPLWRSALVTVTTILPRTTERGAMFILSSWFQMFRPWSAVAMALGPN